MLPGIVTAPGWRIPVTPTITGYTPTDGGSSSITVNGTAGPYAWLGVYRLDSGSTWTTIGTASANGSGNWSCPNCALNVGTNTIVAMAWIGQHPSWASNAISPIYIPSGHQDFGVGTFDFSAPANNNIIVEIWASGGGGAGIIMMDQDPGHEPSQQSSNAAQSSCLVDIAGQPTIYAYGGSRGENCHTLYTSDWENLYLYHWEADGSNGGAANGDINTTGGGSNGGAGQDSIQIALGSYYEWHRGGIGGKGGYVKKTWSNVPQGTNLHIIVGAAGVRAWNAPIGGGGYWGDADGSAGWARVSWS